MNILITGVGGPTPRSFAKAIKKIGKKYSTAKLIGTDINPLAIGLYQPELFDKTYVIPRADSANYWEIIEKIIKQHEIDAAVIQPELEVVVWSKKESEGQLPCKAYLPNQKIGDLLVDKSKMTYLLRDLDLVPKSVSFERGIQDLQPIFDVLGNDFWVRSSSGTSGLGSLRVEGIQSLKLDRN